MPFGRDDPERIGFHPAQGIEEDPFSFQQLGFIRFKADLEKIPFSVFVCHDNWRWAGVPFFFLRKDFGFSYPSRSTLILSKPLASRWCTDFSINSECSFFSDFTIAIKIQKTAHLCNTRYLINRCLRFREFVVPFRSLFRGIQYSLFLPIYLRPVRCAYCLRHR